MKVGGCGGCGWGGDEGGFGEEVEGFSWWRLKLW